MSTSLLQHDHDAGVTRLTFNRPEARNAMTWEMYEALAAACLAIRAEEATRVVVLRGAGQAFVAGTDIAQFRAFSTPDDALGYERRLEDVIGALETLPQPTIAAIDGPATGGGLVLAAACDVRICTTRARLGVPIARTLGNCVSAANHERLLELVGPARLKELLYTGRLLDAGEALDAGLVNRVVDDTALDAAVTDMATAIAANAPLTIRATKEIHRRIRHQHLHPTVDADDVIVSCYTSADFREGVTSFLEKRRPRWSGR